MIFIVCICDHNHKFLDHIFDDINMYKINLIYADFNSKISYKFDSFKKTSQRSLFFVLLVEIHLKLNRQIFYAFEIGIDQFFFYYVISCMYGI